MRYLITGGAGFIGSHLADAYMKRGDSVLILDDLSTGRRENIEHLLDRDTAEFIEGSTLDSDLVDECVQQVDGCLHLASAVGVQLIVAQPLDSVLRNVRSCDIVLGAAAQHRKRLLFTSTSEIYGKNSQGKLPEDADRVLGSPFKSRWAYATSKAFGEILAAGYAQEQGSEMIVARLFNAVGPRQSSSYGMVLPRFVKQALAGEELTVYGTGNQTRCFTHVYDTIEAIVALMDSDLASGNVYNVGATREIEVLSLANQVIELTGSSSEIRLVPYDEAYDAGFEELGRRMPDTTALELLTGWTTKRSVDQAIEDVIEYQKAQDTITVSGS